MRFTYYNLGMMHGGEIIKVNLSGNAANVRLLDSLDFNNYRSGKRHKYYGGYYRKSPVILKVPSPGHWYVAVDLGGFGGSVSSSIQIVA